MLSEHKASIIQLGVCSITIRHENKGKLCIFFLAPGGRPAFLGMPDIKILGIICVKCSIIEPRRFIQEINELSIKDKSCTNKNWNINPMISSKIKSKIDYFIPETEKEADMKASVVITQ